MRAFKIQNSYSQMFPKLYNLMHMVKFYFLNLRLIKK